MPRTTLPLVYACSGCSNVAQLANNVALRLDREGLAQMSCIAGVGGQVPALVNLACSGRWILALDGCALECVASCLRQRGVQADKHLILSQQGLRKRYGEDCSAAQADEVFAEVSQLLGAVIGRPI